MPRSFLSTLGASGRDERALRPNPRSLLGLSTLVLSALALSTAGCQIIAGLGGEEPLGGGGTGTGTNTGGTGGTTTGTGGSGGTGLTGPCTPGQAQDCYSGPDGTDGTGLCKGGTAQCTQEGMWGACDGQVLPAAETCGSTDDEDCNGYDCAVWVNTLLGEVYSDSVAVDAQGNVYAGVSFYTGIDFGDGTPVVPVGNGDMAVLKYDKDGKLLWTKVFPASGQQDIEDIVVGQGGGVALVGTSDSPIDFGAGPIPAGIITVKMAPDGEVLWANSGQSGAFAYPRFVDIDKNGNVFIGGSAKSIDFGTGLLDALDAQSFFVAKFGAMNGNTLWAKITKGGGNETLSGLAVDPSGSVVLSGTWNGPYLGIAGPAQSAPNDVYNCCSEQAPFLLRLDPTGILSDSKMLSGFTGALSMFINGMANDSFGTSTLVGNFSGELSLSSGTYTTEMGGYSLFVIHDQTSGFEQWSKALIAPGVFTGAGLVAVDGHDNMVIEGNYEGPANFGGGILPANKQAFVLKLDKTGQFLWNRAYSFGDGGIQDLAAGTLEDETILIGTFYGSADLGTGPLDAQQGMFIAKLAK